MDPILNSNSKSFRQNVSRGITWTGLARISEKSIGYLRLAILARLLSPSDFGIFGFVLTMMAFLETFSETGIAERIIQDKKNNTKLISTAYLVQVIRGVLLAIGIFGLAEFLNNFFNINQIQVVYVVAGLEILKSFINPAIFLWRKNLLFGKDLGFQLSSSVVEMISAVSLAIWFQNYWALIGGYSLKIIFQIIYSLIASPIYLKGINRKSFADLFKFGRWIHASSVLSFLTHEGDDLVVFKILGANSLGLYQNAYKFSLVPVTGNVFSHFAYPLISAQETTAQKLEKTFKLTWSVSYISYLVGGIIFLFPIQVTLILLGKNWLEMAIALQILIIYGVLRSIGGIVGQYFLAIGKPQINTQINFVKFLILGLLILPSIYWQGIIGASLAVVVSSLLANFLQFLALNNQQGFKNIKLLMPPFISLLVSIGLAFIIIYQINQLWLEFILGSLVFTVSFGLISLFLDKFLQDLFIQVVLPKLPKLVRVGLIKTQLKLKRGKWHDFNWQETAKKASNQDWQSRYDLQWQHDRHDSLLESDINWILKSLKEIKAQTVLEIGPGTGALAQEITKANFNLIALDISQVVLQNLEFKGKRIQARAEALPFADKSLDVIVATHLLEHVSDLEKTISEWKRVAKKGIIIIVPQESKPEVAANYHLQFFPKVSVLESAMKISDHQITSHINPNDHTRYIRFVGKF